MGMLLRRSFIGVENLYIGKAFSPFTLPLFYSYIDNGDPLNSGIIGATMNILRGVSCRVEIDYAKDTQLDFVYKNRQLHIPWLEYAIETILNREGMEGLHGTFDYHFEADFSLDLSSASATLIASLAALKRALSLNYNPIDLGILSHNIELKFKIGFGCTLSQLLGGVVLFRSPSVPGKAEYVKYDYPNDIRVIAVATPMNYFPKYDTPYLREISFNSIHLIKDFNDLLNTSRRFNVSMINLSTRLRGLVKELCNAKFISCGLGFLGNTLYLLTYRDNMADIISILLDFFPTENIFVSEFDPVGVRVYL